VERSSITSDLLIAEAGRQLMANELSIIQAHWPNLRLSAEVTAVHETRKAIRRTFTLFKLFTPYFEPGMLEVHRAGLRKIMRRLAPCRDTAVFRAKIDAYNQAAEKPLTELAACMDRRQTQVDQKLRDYLDRKSTYKILNRYTTLTATEGAGLPEESCQTAPLRVRHVLPELIFRRMGAVRAYGDILATASADQFHQMRIQFKELRYTLTFFEELLDGTGGGIIELSRRIQDYLGDMNDAAVAQDLLERLKCSPEEAAVYGEFQQGEIARLMAEFTPLYVEFDQPGVRRDLALVLASL
jgi:CHAD domain-containing protein